MKSSIFIKLFIPFTGLTLMLTGAILFYSHKLFRENYIETEKENLFHIADLIKPQVEKRVRTNPHDLFNAQTWVMGRDIRITIINKDGKVLADTKYNAGEMENHNNRKEVKIALKEGRGFAVRYSGTLNENMLYTAVLLGSKENPAGTVRVSHFLKKIDSVTGELTKTLFKTTSAALIIALLIMYFVTRQLTRPVRDLKAAVSQIEAGEFDVKLPVKGNDEISDLASHFQTMSRKINYLFRNLLKQKGELTRIIDSIGDGLIVLTENGNIVHTNRKFDFMVGRNIRKNLRFDEEIKIDTLNSYLQKAIQQRKELQEELIIRGKSIFAVSGFIYPIREFVVILHDITELKNLEQIKKDLIANVSHELRTPLTAIKGYVETILDDIDGEHNRSMKIILKHADRMTNIIQDLLILSELESDDTKPAAEKVNLYDLALNMISILGAKAKEKGLQLRLEKSDEEVAIMGDSFRLEQAIINLVENAVKYTEKGEVKVGVEKRLNEAVFTVSDTGPGIEEKHIPRLFERFYVVDKSRSRRVGGTGLGLSIVKHIVQLHGGRIQVDSTPGKGTTFTMTFSATENERAGNKAGPKKREN